jgi:hypothetical protein
MGGGKRILLIMFILTLSLVTLILSMIKMCGLLSSITWTMLFAPLGSVYLALATALIIAVIVDRCGR